MIESAILGKGVFTLLDPEFAGTQEGTLHFHYLLEENGGFLHVARVDGRASRAARRGAARGCRPRADARVHPLVRPSTASTS